ncbi:MAG TPA: hydroxymethylglutaryl-CoA reductase [Gemmatimonadaceae bacterium]|nr:hydroxymethylglutaryl-CoA reductase [Gemmatimonadaceae bacterium]
MQVPLSVGRALYAAGSLANDDAGFRFRLECPLAGASLTRVVSVRVDESEIPVADLTLDLGDGRRLAVPDITPEQPAPLVRRQAAWVSARAGHLVVGAHQLALTLDVAPFGRVEVQAQDTIGAAAAPADDPPAEAAAPAPAAPTATAAAPATPHIPYDKDPTRNYGPEVVAERQRFVEQFTGMRPQHIAHYSFDPAITRGNCENFTGVAQIPLGIAGPLRVNGEHAQGEFLIPLATSEGTLVASYNRGMKVLNLSGGVTCTVSEDYMQRAPVFIFDSAREARTFRDWIVAHLDDLRREAEATSHVAKLATVEVYLANKFAFLRFDFTTGDAAGQNMVGRATYAACEWILANAPDVRRFYLESNFATDKKVSHVNFLRTRGKRVTAEATIPRQVLHDELRVDPETLAFHAGVANVGAFLSGATNNGLHAPNAITAMFIATGQDVANVTEGSAAVIYTEMVPSGDLYLSITIPSLIVATHGGGTGLATQRECLEMLGCWGKGKVNKLAEIVAGVVLAGEISLAAAISSLEWVSAHEKMGRKR